MIKKSLKFTVIIAALVLLTGAVIFCGGFFLRLPRGVRVNGVDVGGLTRTAAKQKLRAGQRDYLKGKRLRICAGEYIYEYTYPEINFTDDFDEVLERADKKGDYTANVGYYLNGESQIVGYICGAINRAPVAPYCTFNRTGEPFTYYGGENGCVSDGQKLVKDIRASLKGGFERVQLSTASIPFEGTMEELVNDTKQLYTFTTYFDGANVGRSANIRLAASKLNGTVISSGEVFSFNKTVGARTPENGFKQAKIIENGQFVPGYGGGVCQVSTTLYNAAVLSGLEICEYHPHTLRVSYVPPSRDAMVSGSYFDLRFKNTRLTPVYIRANCTFNSITCTLYGQQDGFEYAFKSEVIGTLPKPPAVTVVGDKDGVLSYGQEGTLSEGTVIRTRNGISTVALKRRDSYAPSADIISVKAG